MTLTAFRGIEEQLTPEIFPITPMRDWRRIASEPVDSLFAEGLATGTLGVLAAEGGTGKSYLALELALSVTCGKQLIEGFKPTKQGRVLCLFAEDDQRFVSGRLESICSALSITPDEVDAAFNDDQLELSLGNSSPMLMPDGVTRSPAFHELERKCKENRYRLVFIDPLVSFAGIENENDNAMMQRVALALIDLAKACGGAVLCLHHANKAGTQNGNMSQGLARGASSLLCAARWVATMRTVTDKDARQFDIDPEKAENYVEIWIAKNSYAPRSGQRRYLERREGGALVSVDLRDAVTRRIAEAIAEELEVNGGLTRAEIAKGTAKLAKAFQTAVNNRSGVETSQSSRGAALALGLRERMFSEKVIESNRPGAKRMEVCSNG